jgi:LPS-assembly protein
VLRRLSLAFALTALGLRAAPATALHSDFTADTLSTDEATNETVGTGHAELTEGAFLLTADVIRYNQKTSIATAQGHVTMTQGNERLLADTAVFNRVTLTFSATHLRAGSFPFYIEGRTATGTKDVITIQGASITYMEPGRFQPTIKAETIVYSPHHYLRLGGGHLGLGDAQPIPMIHMHENLSRPVVLNYLSSELGYRGSLGPFVDTKLLVPVTTDIRAGLDTSIYTKRGVMIGPGMEYLNPDDEENPLNGVLKTGYIHDYGKRRVDILGKPVPTDRAFAEWTHSQQLTENITIDGEFNWWKDSEVVRDFRPDMFFRVQEPDSFVETMYTNENLFVSGFARYQPNYFDPVQERLPEFRIDLPPTALAFGINERFFGSIANLVDREPTGTIYSLINSVPTAFTDMRSTRFDAFYGLSRPFAITPWFDVTPTVGARATEYTSTSGAVLPGGTFRGLGEIGADATMRASGTFSYKNETWEIDGLRHLITPILSWRYIPDAQKGSLYIPQIDRQTFSTYMPNLDLGDQRNIDELRAQNVLRVGLTNTLQTRDKQYGSRDLVSLNLAQDFRFTQAPGQRDASDIHAEMAITPARWLEISLYDSYSVRPWTVREWDSDIIVHNGDDWSARFGTGYVNDHADDWVAEGLVAPTLTGVDALHIEGRKKINEVWTAYLRADYDARTHIFADQTYGVEQILANTWILRYYISLYSGPSREKGVGYGIRVDAVRF